MTSQVNRSPGDMYNLNTYKNNISANGIIVNIYYDPAHYHNHGNKSGIVYKCPSVGRLIVLSIYNNIVNV